MRFYRPSSLKEKREFINVAVKMLRAGVMIDANQAALQDDKTLSMPLVVV
jgi:hypothetical protein